MGVVNYTCELQVARQGRKAKQKLVKSQLTLFGERASSDTDNINLSKS